MDLGNTTKNQLETTLFDKDGFQFSRVKKNNYKIAFFMENSNIILSKIIDFNLIKLIYDLNGDVYEKVSIEQLNENEFRFTQGGFQKCDGDLDKILFVLSGIS